jgi:putative ABC transport system permease protein
MDNLLQDVRFGARMLLKRPGFAFVAVLTLALGIGANTAVFSFINALFLRPPAVGAPTRLVRLYGATDERPFDVFSYANYRDLRDRTQVFAGLAAHSYVSASLNTGAGAASAAGELVTGNYFDVLGVGAGAGRTLTPADDETEGAHPVVVISHALWQRTFGGAPNVLGQKLYLNAQPFTVIGVMPASFRGSYESLPADFWTPMMMYEQVRPRGVALDKRGWGWLNGTGRLKPGVTLQQAQAELQRVAAQLRQDYPGTNRDLQFRLYQATALPEEFRQGVSGVLGFFMAVVGLVLLTACANVASILLARVMTRRREIAVRQALGATRVRLVRQWLTESLLLTFVGGAAGLLVAIWLSDALLLLIPPDFASFAPVVQLDARVLAFTFVISLGTGLCCGLFPALRAGRVEIGTVLKDEGTGAAGNLHRSRLQQLFVVGQVAVSLLLLVVAGLLLRSLRASESFDPGFRTDNLLLARFDLRPLRYDEQKGRAFYQQLTERLKTLPGVEGATFATVVPLGLDRESQGYIIPGHQPPSGRKSFSLANNVTGPDYFRTMGIPLVRGRDFNAHDADAGAPPVVVINETMARQFWPDSDPLGQFIQPGGTDINAQIIGVARDIKYYTLAEQPQPYVYISFAQQYTPGLIVHLRTTGDPQALARTLRHEVELLDPNVPASDVTTFTELRRGPLFPGRAMAAVSSLFGLLALVLTAVGLYGVMAYSVSQRTREIGIRIALGAHRADIFKLIVGRGLVLALGGIALGLAAAVALTRFLSSLLFNVSATDPRVYLVVSLLLAAVALLACYIPARRATKVDPMIALRYE